MPGLVYHVVHVVLPTASHALSLSFILGHPCFRLWLVSASLDVHYASIAATFSDCRHNGNWHTVHEACTFLVTFCFASSKQVSTVHTSPTRTASLCLPESLGCSKAGCAHTRKGGDQSRLESR